MTFHCIAGRQGQRFAFRLFQAEWQRAIYLTVFFYDVGSMFSCGRKPHVKFIKADCDQEVKTQNKWNTMTEFPSLLENVQLYNMWRKNCRWQITGLYITMVVTGSTDITCRAQIDVIVTPLTASCHNSLRSARIGQCWEDFKGEKVHSGHVWHLNKMDKVNVRGFGAITTKSGEALLSRMHDFKKSLVAWNPCIFLAVKPVCYLL